MHTIRKNQWLSPSWDWPIIFVVLLAYFCLAQYITGDIFRPSQSNYFFDLWQAFRHFHLYVISRFHYDQSLFNNHWYIYWTPTPLLAMLPFILLHVSSDVLFTAVYGVGNVIVLALILTELGNLTDQPLPQPYRSILLLAFAFTTPAFYLSLAGRVWHTEQTINVFYILLSLLFTIKFCRSWRTRYILLSIFFYNLAWIGRIAMLSYGTIYLALLIYCLTYQRYRLAVRIICVGVCMTTVLVSALFLYDYARFHDILETGLSYQGTNYVNYHNYKNAYPGFPFHDVERNIWFSISHIRLNFPYYFFHPYIPFTTNSITRFILIGNSFYSVYPFTLFISLALLGIMRKTLFQRVLIFSSLATILVGLVILLLFLSPGWTQFGNRYFFDLIPACFILLFFAIRKIPPAILYCILVYAIFVNLVGLLTFYMLRPM